MGVQVPHRALGNPVAVTVAGYFVAFEDALDYFMVSGGSSAS